MVGRKQPQEKEYKTHIMNKIKRLLFVSAVVAIGAVSMESCHKDDDDDIIVINNDTTIINEIITDADTTPLNCIAPAFLKKSVRMYSNRSLRSMT